MKIKRIEKIGEKKRLVLIMPISIFEEVREIAYKEKVSRSYLINKAVEQSLNKGNK